MLDNNSWFHTTDGTPVNIYNFQAPMLSPQSIGFWGWAYRCMTQISAIFTGFFDKNENDQICHVSYYPCLTIWSGSGIDSQSFMLLRNYEETTLNRSTFCICSSNWKYSSITNIFQCNPFLIQFLDTEFNFKVLNLCEETGHRINNGVSIRTAMDESINITREEMTFDNSEIYMSINFQSGYWSPEMMPILKKWKDFFFSIKNEKGILSLLSPTVVHSISVNESYQNAINKSNKHGVVPLPNDCPPARLSNKLE
jgi:hypothetical protein